MSMLSTFMARRFVQESALSTALNSHILFNNEATILNLTSYVLSRLHGIKLARTVCNSTPHRRIPQSLIPGVSGRAARTASSSRHTTNFTQQSRNSPATPGGRHPPPIYPASVTSPAFAFLDTPSKTRSGKAAREATSSRHAAGSTQQPPQLINFDGQVVPAPIFAEASDWPVPRTPESKHLSTPSRSARASSLSTYPSPSTPGSSTSKNPESPAVRLWRLTKEKLSREKSKKERGSKRGASDDEVKVLKPFPEDHPDSAIPLFRKHFPYNEKRIAELDMMLRNDDEPVARFDKVFKNRLEILEILDEETEEISEET